MAQSIFQFGMAVPRPLYVPNPVRKLALLCQFVLYGVGDEVLTVRAA